MWRALTICLLGATLGLSGGAIPQEELVYSGTPSNKLSADGTSSKEEGLSAADGAKYRLRIVRRGNKYLWASREDRELTMTSAGRYVIFSSSAGTIKLVNPAFDQARAPLRATDPTEKFDYVEILHSELATVTYWGRGQGVPLPVR